MKVKVIIGLILLALLVTFAVQNSSPVNITFIEWSYSLPLALLVYSSIAIGIVVGFLFTYCGRVRKNKKQKRELKQQQAEKATVAEATPVQG